ncbi:hypothetical protein HY227_01810 [Candidatus Wolfebacteria bacterium]|nr:hypothetical protein [Candidatus Wolfebacteria bacterium]
MIAIIIGPKEVSLSSEIGVMLQEYGDVEIFATPEELIKKMKEGAIPDVVFWKKEFSLPAPPPPNEGIPWEFIWQLVWIRRKNPKVKVVIMSVYNYTSGGIIADALSAYFMGLPLGGKEHLFNFIKRKELFPAAAEVEAA